MDWSQTVDMVGIADYLDTTTNTLPVVVKLETNTAQDYFIGFNRATGTIGNRVVVYIKGKAFLTSPFFFFIFLRCKCR